MRRNNRRVFSKNEKESRKLMIISLIVVAIAILSFVITYMVYSNYLNNSMDIEEFDMYSLGKINNENYFEASSSIGKTVNEVKQEEIENNINNEKIAINTSNMKIENEENEDHEDYEGKNKDKEVDDKNNIKNENVAANSNVVEEKVEDPTFIKPAEGEITVNFAKDTLVYSNTLQEWVTHNGIDIKADKATVVKASAEGIIKSIKNDPRFGITVVIEHVNGYVTVYANLLTAEFVKEGEKVKQGQTIGTVGNTATFEIADEPHLHFEILKDNNYLDPNLYLK